MREFEVGDDRTIQCRFCPARYLIPCTEAAKHYCPNYHFQLSKRAAS